MNQLTAPAIASYSGIVNNAQSGNYSGLVQSAAPQLGVLAQQEKSAQANIMQGPAGPGRDAALAQLPQQQAAATAGTLNQSYQQALQGLTQIGAAYGGVGLSEASAGLSGLQGAGNTYGTVANIQEQSKASTMGFLGSLAGAAGTAAGGGAFGSLGCWVAAAIYGDTDPRTHLVRAWLNGPFRQTFIGNFVMHIYHLIGRRVARSKVLCNTLKPLFDIALGKANAAANRLS